MGENRPPAGLMPSGKTRRKRVRKQAAAPKDARVFAFLVSLVVVVLLVDLALFASLHGDDTDVYGDSDSGGRGEGGGGGSSWSRIGKAYLSSSVDINAAPAEPGIPAAELPAAVDERVREMMDRAGATIDAKLAADLPTKDDLTSLYGEKPVIYGLDTCEAYRNAVPKERALVGPAGIFNSGTNLMASLLDLNCKIDKPTSRAADPFPRMDFMHTRERHGMMWQVPWGKHVPASHRLKNTAELQRRYKTNKDDVLPVVIVKDPYSWMGSMCRHKYQTNWRHSMDHCPNLIANDVDRRNFPRQMQPKGPDGNVLVRIRYPFMVTKHDSLVGVWNDWYGAYHDVTDFPRLIVRYEDLLYQPEGVVAQVCECAGGRVARGDEFRVPSDSAKGKMAVHTNANGLVQALARYGSPKKRVEGLTEDDLRYAKKKIRKDLMAGYGYAFPP